MSITAECSASLNAVSSAQCVKAQLGQMQLLLLQLPVKQPMIVVTACLCFLCTRFGAVPMPLHSFVFLRGTLVKRARQPAQPSGTPGRKTRAEARGNLEKRRERRNSGEKEWIRLV